MGDETDKSSKRKRTCWVDSLTQQDKHSYIQELRNELDGLYSYFNEVNKNMGLNMEGCCSSVDFMMACLLEGSNLPLSKLVDEIFEKVKDRDCSVGIASVRSFVLLNAQRSLYGVSVKDVDVLEDESRDCLWCWETRDVKFIPKSKRGALKIRRTCFKKITERINSVCAMIAALEKPESDQSCRQLLMKASERLDRVLSETDIRLLVGSMIQKNQVGRDAKEGILEINMLGKSIDKSKGEAEKEGKKTDMELQKEKLQREKGVKRLQDVTENEEKRPEEDEFVLRKQLKRKQEEAEKDQRRRQKEEDVLIKRHALQKQASLMERFLKKGKNSSPLQKDPSPAKTDSSTNKNLEMIESVTLSMDSALSHSDEISKESVWKSHKTYWHQLGNYFRSQGKQHWGIRQTPKVELVKELKLTMSTQPQCNNEINLEKLPDIYGETNIVCRPDQTNAECSGHTGPKHKWKKQLFQFDKSHRPAFYGSCPRKSNIIGPRRPFLKDPYLDYDIDSDEEREEEEPGENLSDCDKDGDDDSLEEGFSKVVEEDDSEDGFFVPDGYLSANEGVHDEMECEDLDEAITSSSSCKPVEGEELSVFFRQLKHLHNLTEHALQRSRPLVILNLMHEKSLLMSMKGLNDASQSEQTCLLALSMRPFPGYPSVEISIDEVGEEENLEPSPSSNKGNMPSMAAAATIPDSDLPLIVSVIQSSYAESINKVVDSLQLKFPSIPKSELKSKVREIANFTENRWLVKKDILDKLGMSPYPVHQLAEKSKGKTKHIATFFSKK
ncbi:chromatin assembly factor 1 subunit FAS1-like isoform X2 [Apium graveolens]|uniref:chromatin assembly factor 1 subunit FAS1-like isoform X2 n=1 Tax=Apium graveolens TaxID=4045 RepID=UPI003D7AEAC1